MAITPFTPTPDVSTHADARVHFNNNFADAESRLSSIEATDVNLQFVQQSLVSSVGSVTLDVSSGYNGTITLTENTALSITGATAGSSGVITVRQDATGDWDLSFPQPLAYIMSGNPTDIAFLIADGEEIASITWYFDGLNYLLFIIA